MSKRRDWFLNELMFQFLDQAEKIGLTGEDIIEMIRLKKISLIMNTLIECINVNKSYGKIHAIRNLSIKLEENTIYGLLGRNGAGKTTLLNMITGGIFPGSSWGKRRLSNNC